MLRSLIFLVKLGLVVAVGVWVSDHPGAVHIEWLGYQVDTFMWVGLLALFVYSLFLVHIDRLWRALLAIPQNIRMRRRLKMGDRGLKALTRGFSAVAAGDLKGAEREVKRVKFYLPEDSELSTLLLAQTARLKGEDIIAQEKFAQLLQAPDTTFLGLRGLLSQAVRDNDWIRTMNLLHQATSIHPKQGWIWAMKFTGHIHLRQWHDALEAVDKVLRYNGTDKQQAVSDKCALLLHLGDEEMAQHRYAEARRYYRDAHNLRPDFIPAVTRLARFDYEHGNAKKAMRLVEDAWKQAPHGNLSALWLDMMPSKAKKDDNVAVKWGQRLADRHPNAAESLYLMARIYVSHALWGQAREVLERLTQNAPTKRVYRLLAEMEKAQKGSDIAAQSYLSKAETAPDDMTWICFETGRTYADWVAVVEPNGLFNSLKWRSPSSMFVPSMKSLSGFSDNALDDYVPSLVNRNN